MEIRARFGEWTAGGAALIALALITFGAAAAGAQTAPRAGARWDAWLGCWEPAGAPSGVRAPLMCVVPAAGYSAVDLLTVDSGRVTSREHIDADGQHVDDTRDGCTGWKSAQWSRDGERVYLHADYTCDNGVHRSTSSLIAMSADGQWMDVQGMEAGSNNGVRVLVYREAHDPGPLPPEAANAVGNRAMAVEAARVAASAPIQPDNVVEASHELDAPVVEAWLANHGGSLTVTGDELVALANAGVPGSVTDVMVALSNPQRFALRPAAPGAQGQYAQAPAPTEAEGAAVDTTRPPCPYSAYAWDYGARCAYSPYLFPSWGYGYYGYYGPYGFYNPFDLYSPYGYYGPYSYGYGYGGYGGWFGYGQPVIIVQKGGAGTPGSHGRMVKGRGYVSGAPSGGASSRQGGASSGAATSRGGGSSAGSAGASGGRTAHRTGGGGH